MFQEKKKERDPTVLREIIKLIYIDIYNITKEVV